MIKFAIMNSVMQELRLPETLRLDIRSSVITTEPSLQSHKEMRELLKHLPPSLNKKIIQFQTKLILMDIDLFKDDKDMIEFLLNRVEIAYYSPEVKIIKQFDKQNQYCYMTRQGSYQVERQIDLKEVVYLGIIEDEALIGEQFLLFNKPPNVTVICQSYCTVG